MTGIAIYMEGGGDSRDSRVALRQGMDGFLAPLKQLAGKKSWRWRLVTCGGRNAAYGAFREAARRAEDSVILLVVDAEEPVATAAWQHLARRDGWVLTADQADQVHLMIQTMETWIVADPDKLAEYYRQGFAPKQLPKHANLEAVAKADVATALDLATRSTTKGAYHKFRHSSALLAMIRPCKVKLRCPSCARLFTTIEAALNRKSSA